jgi:hypothetical protein
MRRMTRTFSISTNEAGMQWVMAALLIAALGSACDRDDASMPSTQLAPAPTATVEQVDEDPMRFHGKRVRLGGEIDKVYSPRAFELEGEGVWWDEQILVVARSPVTLGGRTLAEDDEVMVSGTVKKLTVAEVERELGWDLDPQIEIEFRDLPVLLADTVTMSGAQATWSEKDHPQGTMVGLMRLWTAPDLSQLAGQSLIASDVPVRSKIGKAMWIGYNELGQILVVPNDAATLEAIEDGERVMITGTVEKMPPADVASKMWNLPRVMEAQLAPVPVYINATRLEKAGLAKMTMNFRP